MDNAKQQLIDKLKTANNVLVTVSRNPSVDGLSALLGLSLLLNKQGKHSAAVFSGTIPSTIEFLKPENTIERNTDSMRDFIIALDKSKADKLRYKVEDNIVRIFITPYKTSISENDLEFSQGDFNVDLVVALGVTMQEDIDAAITAHGRILHDATVASINLAAEGGLGSINWNDQQASSLSELVTELIQALAPDLLDSQIATALLTGIVSSTDRFGNDRTSSQTMSVSAALLAAGANQQLVATKLEEAERGQAPIAQSQDGGEPDDGTIQIDHTQGDIEESNPEPEEQPTEVVNDQPPETTELPEPTEPVPEADATVNDEVSDNLPPLPPLPETPLQPGPEAPTTPQPGLPTAGHTTSPGSKLITGPPTLGGTLTANSRQEPLDPVTDPMSLPNAEPPQLLERKPDTLPELTPHQLPADNSQLPADDSQSSQPTLSDLEEEVKEKEAVAGEAAGLNNARDEVSRALSSDQANMPPEPIQALNAQPLGDNLHSPSSVPAAPLADLGSPKAPPVPPPIPFQFGNPPQN